jgi:hypothetical protein
MYTTASSHFALHASPPNVCTGNFQVLATTRKQKQIALLSHVPLRNYCLSLSLLFRLFAWLFGT